MSLLEKLWAYLLTDPALHFFILPLALFCGAFAALFIYDYAIKSNILQQQFHALSKEERTELANYLADNLQFGTLGVCGVLLVVGFIGGLATIEVLWGMIKIILFHFFG